MKKNLTIAIMIMMGLLGSCTKEIDSQDIKEDQLTATRAGGDGKYDLAGYGYDITRAYFNPTDAKNSVINVDALYAMDPVRVNVDNSNLAYTQCIGG